MVFSIGNLFAFRRPNLIAVLAAFLALFTCSSPTLGAEFCDQFPHLASILSETLRRQLNDAKTLETDGIILHIEADEASTRAALDQLSFLGVRVLRLADPGADRAGYMVKVAGSLRWIEEFVSVHARDPATFVASLKLLGISLPNIEFTPQRQIKITQATVDTSHFNQLHDLGYVPPYAKALDQFPRSTIIQSSDDGAYDPKTDPVNPASDLTIKRVPMSRAVQEQLNREANLTPHHSAGVALTNDQIIAIQEAERARRSSIPAASGADAPKGAGCSVELIHAMGF